GRGVGDEVGQEIGGSGGARPGPAAARAGGAEGGEDEHRGAEWDGSPLHRASLASVPRRAQRLDSGVSAGGLRSLLLAAAADDLLEAADVEDRDERDEPEAEGERGQRDLLADGVRGDGAGRG